MYSLSLLNRDFHTMIKLSIWRSLGRQKSMCFAAKGRLQGRAAKLLLVRWKSRCNECLGQICLAANGSLSNNLFGFIFYSDTHT